MIKKTIFAEDRLSGMLSLRAVLKQVADWYFDES